MSKKHIIYLLGIVCLGLFLRVFSINWDQGFHLHPDERAIILYILPLQFSTSIQEFFSPQSLWNPHFFAYGSFPLYLLKIIGFFVSYFYPLSSAYDYLTFTGRVISAFFDTATIICIYFLAKKVFKHSEIAFLSSIFYALCVLPIQLAHFYAVDTVLTFFTTFLLYKLTALKQIPTIKTTVSIGIIFAFALATKISSLVLLLPISITFLLYFYRTQKQHHGFSIVSLLQKIFFHSILLFGISFVTFFILEPYAIIDFPSFYQQSQQQAEMTKSAFTFPYTLQYVGKIAYMYEIKNVILWGMGPVLGCMAWIGFLYLIYVTVKKKSTEYIILLSFFIPYLVIIGNFAIGFMRYMLPLYPFLCIFAGYITFNFFRYLHKKNHLFANIFLLFIFISITLWTVSFLHIYTQEPTRVSATKWILKYIPKGKTLAIEHWDDALPLFGQENYSMTTLELYNPDTKEKWEIINNQLAAADYIILASNRLYTPLQKLTNCQKLPPFYCYKQTAQYYEHLFTGKSRFKKIAEFSVYPTIPFLWMPINDQLADESFTVYDHPQVIIFKKAF